MAMIHFLAHDSDGARNPRAPFAVLPIPFERSVCYGRGTAKAPAAILKASVQAEMFDEEFFIPRGLRVQTLPAICCKGARSLVFTRIRRRAEGVMRSGRFLMSLGGEHTITFPLVAAARSAFNDVCVLNFDAHLDLRHRYKNNVFSHACVFRRVMELNVPVIHVGARSLCREEHDLVRRLGLDVFWARQILSERTDAWMSGLLKRLNRNVYISFDSDCLDPALMPGTGTPEPGGLPWMTVMRLLKRVCFERTVVAADIVEVIPVPGTSVSEYTAAKLALKLMTYLNLSHDPDFARGACKIKT